MSPKIISLKSPGGASATIYPEKGFNCVQLDLVANGSPVCVIHAEPDVLSGGSPTRSGMPVLFPFPNRIADATYDWRGKEYQLPVAHPGDRHAIHGFVCRTEWIDVAVDPSGSSATGRFRLSRDSPERLQCWPGDLELVLEYRLSDDTLAVNCEVRNVDQTDVPFGLGFHAYLNPLDMGVGPGALSKCRVSVDAESYWVLDDSIPTGEVAGVAGDRDLRTQSAIADRQLDDVLTDLPQFHALEDGLMTRATLTGRQAKLLLECDENWRDIVVFTPANGESVAIEPYTCPTDAVHLDERGLQVGWRVLAPGESWSAGIRLSLDSVG